ncbi:lysophospholipid acyltransferase family protein [bacterium]|nr:lysophospholipid acyltransferase family protein [bacterium]
MSIRDRAEYGVFRTGLALLRALPRRWSAGLLHAAGRAAVRHNWWRAEVARRQMAAAFPEREAADIETLLAKMYRHLADSVCEIFIERESPPLASAPAGEDALGQALQPGKGLILASLHLGNFELCGRVIAARCDLLDVVKPQRNRVFDRYIDAMRNRHGIATVPMDRSGPAVLAQLRRGGVVSLLLDQDAGDKGVVVDFLGRPASTWPGAARLSLQTGCPVLPVCLVRGEHGEHELVCGPLLDPAQLPETQRNPTAFTALITAHLEEFVRRRPQQWFWVHRRWKGAAQKDRRPGTGTAVAR